MVLGEDREEGVKNGKSKVAWLIKDFYEKTKYAF